MNETEWNESTDPQAMLEWLGRAGASERKLRLFAVAVCHHIESLLSATSLECLAVAERLAEGLLDGAERKVTRAKALAAEWVGPPEHRYELVRHARGSAKQAVCEALARRARDAAIGAARCSLGAAVQRTVNQFIVDGGSAWEPVYPERRHAEGAAQAALLRCIFGPLPFRDVAVATSWRTPSVQALAERIYEGRSFDRMRELGAALQEAGCEDEDILAHCRGPGAHVRGCWIVDLLLDKR